MNKNANNQDFPTRDYPRDEIADSLATALAELETSATKVARLANIYRHNLEQTVPLDNTESLGAVHTGTPPTDSRPPTLHTPIPEQDPPSLSPSVPPPAPPSAPAAPQPARSPWWTNEKQIVRIIATFGGLITAAGIAFFVAVAIQMGLLGPVGRVVLAFALAAVLAGASRWAYRRKAFPAGVTALMATSLATASLTALSMWALLDWIPAGVAIALILVFTCGGFFGARWAQSSATAAWSVVIGGGLMCLIAMNTDGKWGDVGAAISHLGLPLLTIAGTAILWRQPLRPYVAAFLLAGNLSTGFLAISGALEVGWLGIIYTLMFIAGQFGPLLLTEMPHETPLEHEAQATTQSDGVSNTRKPFGAFTFEKPLKLAIVAAVSTPLVVSAAMRFGGPIFVGGCLVIGAAFAGLYLTKPSLRYFAPAAFATSPIPWLFFAYDLRMYSGVAEINSDWPIIPISLVSVAATWLLIMWPAPRVPRYTLLCAQSAGIAWFFAANIAHAYLIPTAMRNAGVDVSLSWAEFVSLLLLLLTDIGMVAAAARQKASPVLGLVGLAAAALPFIHLLMYVGLGFSLSHMLLSISWATIAGVLVLSPRFRHIQARLAAGLTIAALAIIKLIFFDMATLDGIIRAAAFIVCGLILLAMAVSGAKQRDRVPSQKTESAEAPTEGLPQDHSIHHSTDTEKRL